MSGLRAKPRARVTVLGGGNGIANVLKGLAEQVRAGAALDITAIVATADDGGSSGRIRRERGGLPPGDLRNCLIALADGAEAEFGRLFSHRFAGTGDLAGHSLGNLLLIALAEREGCWLRAVDTAGRMLGTCGRVIPVTPSGLRLEGRTVLGERVSGESRIGAASAPLHSVWLEPAHAIPSPGVLDSLRVSDLIVLGPGSLFTSLLPVLLVDGVADAIRDSRATRVFIGNLMTQPGETLGMSLGDHLEALDRHVGAGLADTILLNDSPIAAERMVPYEEQCARLVSRFGLARRPEIVLEARLVNEAGKIRHDPAHLGRVLFGLATRAGAPARAASAGRQHGRAGR